MKPLYVRIEGTIARVRDRTVSSEASGGASLLGDGPMESNSTQYFNEVEIDLAETATPLALLLRWPDRLFVQSGDRVVAWCEVEDAGRPVAAFCNLTDGSNYLLVGSPFKRRRLKRLAAEHLSNESTRHWHSA